MLLRLGGRYILIDPVLSERASPLSFYGPKRRTPAPLTVEQLPAVDAVLISIIIMTISTGARCGSWRGASHRPSLSCRWA